MLRICVNKLLVELEQFIVWLTTKTEKIIHEPEPEPETLCLPLLANTAIKHNYRVTDILFLEICFSGFNWPNLMHTINKDRRTWVARDEDITKES